MNKTIKITVILISIFLLLYLSFYKINCLLIKGKTEEIAYIEKINEKDEIVLSHINSIYDEKVDEIFYMEGDMLILKDIKTSSYGVKEYYGITEGITHRKFSTITFRNTKDREFSLWINGKKIKKIDKLVNTPITIELKKIPLYKYFWIIGTSQKFN